MTKDIGFYIGETWTIDGVAMQPDGTPLDLTGGTVEFRVASSASLILKAVSPTDITIADGTEGTYTLNIAATDSRMTSLQPGTYTYEIDAINADGGVTVQNTGKIALKSSLRKLFP